MIKIKQSRRLANRMVSLAQARAVTRPAVAPTVSVVRVILGLNRPGTRSLVSAVLAC